MQIDIRFELKPKQRPKLAEEIATALHTVPCYQKAPSLAYKIGDCTLERDGTLRIPDSVDRETVSNLLEHLKGKGFTGEAEQTEDRLTVSMPKELFTLGTLENLAKLVENKGGLMARAFQADEIRITVTEDAVSFPWFPFTANVIYFREIPFFKQKFPFSTSNSNFFLFILFYKISLDKIRKMCGRFRF